MATTTPNVGLTKPDYTDPVDIQVLNDNFDTIDYRLGSLSKKVKWVSVVEKGAKGNGTDDDTQAFIDALSESNNVHVPVGYTFLIGDVDVSGKRIFGGGTIKKKSGSESAFHIKNDGTVIEGLNFLGEATTGQPNSDIKLGDGARNIRITNCTFNSPIYSAISGAIDIEDAGGTKYNTPVSGVLISNNVFNGYARPLFMHSIENLTITNNIIRDSAFDAIRLRENDGFVLIDGNQFINIGDPAWVDDQTRDAIDTKWSGQNLTITNNIVRKTAYHGFDIKGSSPDGSINSSKIIIANNQIYQTRYSGISIAGDSNYDGAGNYKFITGVIISNNIVQECNQNNIDGTGNIGDAAIRLKMLYAYVSVTGNYVFANYGRGIYLHNNEASKSIAKSVRVSGNICVNNGHSSKTTGFDSGGIMSYAIDGLIISENICENDPSLPNPYQLVGILTDHNDNGYVASRSMIVKNNICKNNISYQILTNSNNERNDGIAVYSENVEIGEGANFRSTWQHQRGIYFGSGIPGSGDGTFRQGDIIYNVGATASGKVGWVCVAGGAPGTWKPFGVIDA